MIEKQLTEMYEEYFEASATRIEALPGHASSRRLFRMQGSAGQCIGAHHGDLLENRAFLGFARTFQSFGLNVPQVFTVSDCETFYLMSDLGSRTLFEELQSRRKDAAVFPPDVLSYYRSALSELVRFQVQGAKIIDFSLCYQGEEYGEGAMRGDMLAFEKKYLARVGIQYDRVAFQQDSDRLIAFLAQSRPDFFMYRDFQARNIVVENGTLGFVDFQGGRRGPLQYDVVSLLFQSQAELPSMVREELLAHYLTQLGQVHTVEIEEFKALFYGYVLMRLYQVLATYGQEGLGNRKPYFLHGIPIALGLLKEVSEEVGFPVNVTELADVTRNIILNPPE